MELKSHIDVLGGLSPLCFYDTFIGRKVVYFCIQAKGQGGQFSISTMYVMKGGTQLRTG